MTITIVAPACAFTDYGYTAIELFDRLKGYGHDTKFKPMSVLERLGKKEVKVPQAVKDSFVKQSEGLELFVCDVSALPLPSKDAVLVTTLRGVSEKHVGLLNKFKAIACVGMRHQVEMAEKLGVTTKIHEVEPGIDVGIFDSEYRKAVRSLLPKPSTLRFLACGRNERSLLLESWRESFKGVKDVRLCVMCDDWDLFKIEDDRVLIVDYPINNRQLANVMEHHDAFIVPSTRCDFRIWDQCFAGRLPTIGITTHGNGLKAWSKLVGTDLVCDKTELIGQMRFAYQDRKALSDSILLRELDGWESIEHITQRVCKIVQQ